MKALSVAQPYATLLVLGAKRLETRPWQTAHRGPLAVHAARNLSAAARALCRQDPFRSLLRAGGIMSWSDLPRGAVVGAVELTGCARVEDLPPPEEPEASLGDFSPGRWVWQLRHPLRLPAPLPARGRLGLFDVDLSVTLPQEETVP
jgi:activating signal cointegrator 1